MNTTDTPKSTIFRVGFFTLLGLALIAALTVFVNDRPFWWRACQPIVINVDDATGLKNKSPVRSLGLQIGYLKSVELSETKVRLAICLTAKVQTIPETRAYVRGEGFLGDKFIELKPIHYTGGSEITYRKAKTPTDTETVEPAAPEQQEEVNRKDRSSMNRIMDWVIPSAQADEPKAQEVKVGKRPGDMDKMMESADKLMIEMTDLTKNLKEGLNPKELKNTIQQLNKTLENASKVLSPEGGLNSSARRSLEKLEEAFEQLRQQMTKINQGEGSIGRLLNDPIYAEELLKAAKNLNKILNRTADMRFEINVGMEQIPVYDGGRGFFQLRIWPTPSRYYLVGFTIDPRGKRKVTDTTTTVGSSSMVTRTEQIEQGGMLITGMLGKVFYNRFDLAVGAIHGDGAVSVGLLLGPNQRENVFEIRSDTYSRGQGVALNDRLTAIVRPFAMFDGLSSIYVKGGIESLRKVNGQYAYLFGAGISFDDEDIKLLFTFL